MYTRNIFLFAPDDTGGEGSDPPDETDVNTSTDEVSEEEQEFDNFLQGLDAETSTKLKQHTDALLSALRKERKTAREVGPLRKQLTALQQAEQDRKRAQLTELEKAQSDLRTTTEERDRLLSQIREERIRNAVGSVAVELEFADPYDAYRLIDLTKVTLGDNETVEGHRALLKALAEQKPYLLRKAGQGAGLGNNTSGKGPKKPEQQTKTPAKTPPVPHL